MKILVSILESLHGERQTERQDMASEAIEFL
jgi:hypothetical protein